jgi:hypothetical protein
MEVNMADSCGCGNEKTTFMTTYMLMPSGTSCCNGCNWCNWCNKKKELYPAQNSITKILIAPIM